MKTCYICGFEQKTNFASDIVSDELYSMHPKTESRVDGRVQFLKMGGPQGTYDGPAELCFLCMNDWIKALSGLGPTEQGVSG